MEGETKTTLKHLTNQPASVHNYGKPSRSESPRTHSSPTSILRKFPHSLRHDQKHRTKIKRDEGSSGEAVAPVLLGRDGKTLRNAESRRVEDERSDDSEERPSAEDSDEGRDDDSRKKRKFSETSASSESSSDGDGDGDVWKLRPAFAEANNAGSPRERDSTASEQRNPKDAPTTASIKKLSVINNSCKNGSGVNKVSKSRRRLEFPVHKSTPNLLRSEAFGLSTSLSPPESVADRSSDGTEFSGGKPAARRDRPRIDRHVPLKTSDSLPQLDHTYRIIHSILPKINRAASESRESLESGPKKRKPHVRSVADAEGFRLGVDRRESVSSRTSDVGATSDVGQSDEENEGLSLIDGRRNAIVQSAKDRKPRWSYKKTVDIMPSLRNLVSRRSRGDSEEPAPPGASTPFAPSESCSSLNVPQIRYFDETDEELSVKKCETIHALSNLIGADSNFQVEPMKAVNRLRVPPNGFYGSTSRMCSRCSSLLSMASSRYSINTTGSGFVNCSASEKTPEPLILCKLCLLEVPASMSMEIGHCGCVFCKDCMRLYVEFEIQEGAYDISCPDAQCVKQGVVTIGEAETLVMPQMMERYLRFRLNHEVDMDRNRTWCPRAGCETVCDICPREKCAPTSVHCPTCDSDFCSNCKNAWHKDLTCEENSRKLAKEGRSDFMEPGIPFDSDSIKCCPTCNVPIEKDEGCAQMMCKRCKHVFCWYCLASLDDDFLLRHYDKGPCKNKLGHSRASVIWHRTQVIGIFAGLGLLLLVASPLLLLAAPCIVCCKCRVCSGTKLDADDDLPEESGT